MVPGSPQKLLKCELENLTKDQIVQRVLDLKCELDEFQESSKELEQALEDEVETLENANCKLNLNLVSKDEDIQILKGKIMSLNIELKELQSSNNDLNSAYKCEIKSLKEKLVDIEIANESVSSQNRLLLSQLELSTQQNNELLEKIALIEYDLERELTANAEKELYLLNYRNKLNEMGWVVDTLKEKLSHRSNLGSRIESPLGSSLIFGELEISQGLKESSEYPKLTVKKSRGSDSQLNSDHNPPSSFPLKSTSTIHVSKQLHLAKSIGPSMTETKDVAPNLHLSKSIRNLSKRVQSQRSFISLRPDRSSSFGEENEFAIPQRLVLGSLENQSNRSLRTKNSISVFDYWRHSKSNE
ncbi:uncharacterized protein PRCAT00006173001 [Priceomyces carsonii]|uniref:uncharacterized protein n=1 Tax=Priceomyces carsonii TaxID=28549 RepID=UPI002ED90DF0|nr:unnamed protein product [Priceomyces carsonii]